MMYFWNNKQVSRDEVKQLLLAEYEESKNSPTFPGRIFYNLDYLEHCAKQYMTMTKEKSWAYFSLRIVGDNNG